MREGRRIRGGGATSRLKCASGHHAPRRWGRVRETAEDYCLCLGMPGTGKTTTIARLLQALVAQVWVATSFLQTAGALADAGWRSRRGGPGAWPRLSA